jgi:hypothetical protein
MKTGWIQNSNEEYHASEGLSASGVVQILRSPAHYKYGDNGPKKDTPYGS